MLPNSFKCAGWVGDQVLVVQVQGIDLQGGKNGLPIRRHGADIAQIEQHVFETQVRIGGRRVGAMPLIRLHRASEGNGLSNAIPPSEIEMLENAVWPREDTL